MHSRCISAPSRPTGRARETGRALRGLRVHRAVAFVGFPGIGKTTLLRAVFQRLRGPGTWGSCVAGGDAGALCTTAEAALGLPAPPLFSSPAERAARLAEHLNAATATLFLDDVDRCPDSATVLGPLVRALDGGRLVYASRRRIHLGPSADAEQLVCPVGPLAQDAAVRLARQVLRARGLPADRAEALARAARGHPLALKLAASCETAEGGLAAVLDLVLQGLTRHERRWLADLGAHRIPVEIDAPPPLEERLLVERTPAGLVLHDLVRAGLGALGPEAHARAAEYYAPRSGADAVAAREWIHHLLAARHFRTAASALERTAAALWKAGEHGELCRFLEATASRVPPGPVARVARALYAARERPDRARRLLGTVARVPAAARSFHLMAAVVVGYARGDRRQIGRALGRMDRRRLPDPETYALALQHYASSLVDAGNAAAALRLVRRAERRLGSQSGILLARGIALEGLGRYPEALAAAASALEVGAGMLNRRTVAALYHNMADAHLRLGDPVAARDLLRKALALVDPLEQSGFLAALRAKRVCAAARQVRPGEALAALEPEIRVLARQSMYRAQHAGALIERARIRRAAGDLAGGRADLEKALAVAERAGDRAVAADACARLATLECDAGRIERATELCESAASAERPDTRALAHLARARIASARGAAARADREVGRALVVCRGLRPLEAEAFELRAACRGGTGAIEALEQAACAAAACRDPRTEARLRERRADLLLAAGDAARARADLEQAAGLLESVGEDAGALRGRLSRSDLPGPRGFIVDFARRRVHAHGRPVELRRRPLLWRVLEVLLTFGGRPVGKDALFRAVWGHPYRRDLHDGNVHLSICRLRRALAIPEAGANPGDVALVTSPDGYALVGPVTAREGDLAREIGPPPARAAQILALADRTGVVANADVRRLLGVFRVTASRYLAGLVGAGRLRREGRGRGARYRRADVPAVRSASANAPCASLATSPTTSSALAAARAASRARPWCATLSRRRFRRCELRNPG